MRDLPRTCIDGWYRAFVRPIHPDDDYFNTPPQEAGMPDDLDRPNVLLITCHDLGRHLGCYGRDVHSPNLDALADRGVRFDQTFCTAPQCSPSRGSLHTGRYPHRNGLMGLAHIGWELYPEERCLADFLADDGYETSLFGFQHVSDDPHRLGYETAHDDVREEPELTERFEREVDDLGGDEPFFACVGFVEPHREYRRDYVAEEARERYDPETVEPLPYLPDRPGIREDIAACNALIEGSLDRGVGNVLEALEDAGLREDTLILFTTDHGLAMPRAKGTLYDAGTETALIADHPDLDSGTSDALLSNVDVMPTILDLAGVDTPENLDGRSFRPLLDGGDGGSDAADYRERDRVYTELTWHGNYTPLRAVRTAEEKYIRAFAMQPGVYMPSDIMDSPAGEEVATEYYSQKHPEEEYYDLAADPHEQESLAADSDIPRHTDEDHHPDYADRIRALREDLHRWMSKTEDPLLEGPIPIRGHHHGTVYVGIEEQGR